MELRRRGRLQKVVLWTLVVVLSSSTAVEAAKGGLKGKWWELRSEHFLLVTDARRTEAYETIEHLERIRAVFVQALPGLGATTGPPLVVLAARNERSMSRLMPEMYADALRARPAGVFRSTPTASMIAVRTDLIGGENFRVLYHEYFHAIVSQAGMRLPAWASEGLANFWGGTRLTSEKAEVGRADMRRLEALKSERLLPLEVLFSVDHSSPHYAKRHQASQFYAQSWALTHYLLLGDESGERSRQMQQYLARVVRGEDSLAAAKASFGNLKTLEKELKPYSRSLLFDYAKMPLPEAVDREKLVLRELSRGEAASRVAFWILNGGTIRNAEPYVDQALAEEPELSLTQLVAGLKDLLGPNPGDAEAALEQAIRVSDAGALAHYSAAASLLYRDRRPQALHRAETLLLQAISKDPGLAPAYARLGWVYLQLDTGTARAQSMVRRALRLHPTSEFYRLLDARIALLSGDREGALEKAREVARETMRTESGFWNRWVCEFGTRWGLVEGVFETCDEGVRLADGHSRAWDGRALARVLRGEGRKAIGDFRAALERSGEIWWPEGRKDRRREWIRVLESGTQLDPEEVLRVLEEDPDERVVGWYY